MSLLWTDLLTLSLIRYSEFAYHSMVYTVCNSISPVNWGKPCNLCTHNVGCNSGQSHMCSGAGHGGQTDGSGVCGVGRDNAVEASRPGPVGGETRLPHGNAALTGSQNCKWFQ